MVTKTTMVTKAIAPVYKVATCAEISGYSQAWWRLAIHQGVIPVERWGSTIRVTNETLRRVMAGEIRLRSRAKAETVA